MSAISIHTIHTFEKETSSFKLFLTHLLSHFSSRVSLSNRAVKTLTGRFNKLYEQTNEIQANFSEIEQKEAKKLFKIASVSSRKLIKLKEGLEKENYFDNEELKTAVKKCLKSFYLLEAKAKKATSSTISDNTEHTIKQSLSAHSKVSIATKLSNLK